MDKYIPNIIGIGEFQKNASSFLKNFQQKHREGLIVSHNKPQAVIMSLKRYEELRSLEEAFCKEEEEIVQIVKEGTEEYKSRNTHTTKSMKAFLD